MEYYKTEGVCAREIEFSIEDNRIESVDFKGGCDGNLKGIKSLVTGMDINQVIEKLEGIKCGSKSTSCPDQLSRL